MWQRDCAGQRRDDEVPIGHVTNGVHIATWMAAPMQALLDRHLGADWRARARDPATWAAGRRDPRRRALGRALPRCARALVEYVRERATLDRLARGEPLDYVEPAARAFDPDALTIGFARRVATYKRLHLLMRDLPSARCACSPATAARSRS